MYVRLLRLPEDVRNKYDLSSVKFVGSTGAPCAPDVKRGMIDWWDDVINETHAASETGHLTAISSAEARLKPGSAGRPIEGVSINIMDDDGNEVAAGVIGKIYARHSRRREEAELARWEEKLDAAKRRGQRERDQLAGGWQSAYRYIP